MPRIVIDVGGIDYDKGDCERLRDEMARQRDVALTGKPPDYAQAIILAHVVGWMTYVIDTLWPADEYPPPPLRPQRWTTEPVEQPPTMPMQQGWTVPAEQVENSPDSDAPIIIE